MRQSHRGQPARARLERGRPGRAGAAWWRRLWWRRDHTRRQVAEKLYRAVVKQARTPVFFRELGAPDTPEGRFEVIALHAGLVLRRLRREGAAGRALGQTLFDLMFADLDGGLRELGVGDLSVGKYVKRLAGNFYARLAALDAGLADAGLADPRSLHPMLLGNVYRGGETPSEAQLSALAGYLVALDRALANQEVAAIREGVIAWVVPRVPSEAPPAAVRPG